MQGQSDWMSKARSGFQQQKQDLAGLKKRGLISIITKENSDLRGNKSSKFAGQLVGRDFTVKHGVCLTHKIRV